VAIGLSCADYAWPSAPHRVALDLIHGLGFDAVDIGYFAGRSHVRPEDVGEEIAEWAGRLGERLAERGLAVADVFAQSADFGSLAVNHPDRAERDRSAAEFARWVEFARRLGSPGLTILPGVMFSDDVVWENAFKRSVEGLRWRVEEAAAAGLALSVEPHTGSVTDTPERAARLLAETPGLTLTLDYAHFVYNGATDDLIEPLLPHARHVQCRGGAPGVLQADMRRNRIDYPRAVDGLRARDYHGYLACEYVWSDWLGCNEVDNLTETVALRDVLRAALGADTATA
jgi:sugar phosphate isomerase/epimerase